MASTDDKPEKIEIFTDGACSGNPGPGGWGAILRWRDHERELSGGEVQTTNNRMELMAAIVSLESLKRSAPVVLHTDSKNEDLWRRLEAALKDHEIEWVWVKGHAGHVENERADQLARDAVPGRS